METRPAMPEAPILSFQAARRSIGTLGLFLPFSLMVSSQLTDGEYRDSISGYYYSAGGGIMIGTLCAMASFLWSYVGHRQRKWYDPFPSDMVLSRIAAVSGALVALVPTTAPKPWVGGGCALLECLLKDAGLSDKAVMFTHSAFGAIFFLALATFCLANFRRSTKAFTLDKYGRNLVFLVCGCVVLGSIVLLGLYFFVEPVAMGLTALFGSHAIFWLESIAVWAFAFAWFIKGETAGKAGRRTMVGLGALVCLARRIAPWPESGMEG